VARIETRTKGASSRPPLEPADPITTQVALIQVVLLLGIPLGLLALAKVVLSRFFPGLGY
jgi:hypothetical protein